MSIDTADRKVGELAGKVALITGAASGIGLAITRRFCERASPGGNGRFKHGKIKSIHE